VVLSAKVLAQAALMVIELVTVMLIAVTKKMLCCEFLSVHDIDENAQQCS